MKIIAIVMVKNEERFIGGVIRNILAFCDKIIVIDTGCTDQTIEEIRKVDDIEDPLKVHLIREPDLTKTHRIAERYLGAGHWIFGVDGDEIYDPGMLLRMRVRIMSREFDNAYQVKGMYLHATEYTKDGKLSGYFGPPSHNPTKLYNFANIEEWPSDGHTLFHPKAKTFAKGSHKMPVVESWYNSDLRCLHMRFFQRSRQESREEEGRRLTPEDVAGYGSKKDRGGTNESNERLQYQIGEIVTVDTAPFGDFDSWR